MACTFARTALPLALAAACGREAETSAVATTVARSDAPGADRVEPSAPVLGPARDTPGIAFDCSRIAPRVEPKPCAPTPAAVTELVAVAQADAHAFTMHDAREPRAHWARARAAIAGMSAVVPDDLPIEIRVAAQNAALRIAFDAREDLGLARAALAEVARLASPTDALRRLGAEPDGLEPWLGPRDRWQARERGDLPSLHAAIGPHAHYRMIQGTHRAVVHQLVAVDTAGAPHVTSLVGEIELRESDASAAPACVAQLDAARLGCGLRDALTPIDASVHDSTHFMHAKPDGSQGCNDCHTSTTFPLVAPGRAAGFEDEQRRSTIDRVAERLRTLGPTGGGG